ncbi:MAG TPA: DoxX family protein [Chthoniobacterales bacterium]|nr:DoxX family protein [Chthoniobacterales bacterium]
MNFLGRFSEPIYSIFRFVTGFLFMCHGLQKVFGMLSPRGGPATGLPMVSGYIELIGGTLVMLGLFTTIAAFICSGTMAVAYFMAHAGQGLFPIVNRGELAVLYAFVFLYIAARGSGKWSLDAMMFNHARAADTMPLTR